MRRKTQKFTDRWARTFQIKMLAPNWAGHDMETNTIVNYFADRQHTELSLRKIEKKIETCCFYCKECENWNFSGTKKCSNGMVFGHLTKTLNTGMFMTQTGAKGTKSLEFYRLQKLNLRCKNLFLFENKKV